MRVLFYTAAMSAALLATLTHSIKLETSSYDFIDCNEYSQLDVNRSEKKEDGFKLNIPKVEPEEEVSPIAKEVAKKQAELEADKAVADTKKLAKETTQKKREELETIQKNKQDRIKVAERESKAKTARATVEAAAAKKTENAAKQGEKDTKKVMGDGAKAAKCLEAKKEANTKKQAEE